MKKEIPETQRLDGEIMELSAKIEKLRSTKERNAAIGGSLNVERERLSFSAMVSENPSAIESLKRLMTQIRENEEQLTNLDSALRQAGEKLNELQSQRVDAYRQEKLAELEVETAQLISTDAKNAETALLAFLAAQGAIHSRVTHMTRLAREAAADRNFSVLLKNFSRSCTYRLGYSTGWIPKDAKQSFETPLGDLFARILKGEPVADDEDTQERQAG